MAEPTGISDGIARRIGAQLLHEVGEALPPTIFFFVGFNFIVLTTNLLVAQYLVAVSNFMLATVGGHGGLWLLAGFQADVSLPQSTAPPQTALP